MKMTIDGKMLCSFVWALLAVYAVMLLPTEAWAAIGEATGVDTMGITKVMCNVVSWFTGKVGGGIATLAIIVIGVGALMGKVSWGMAIIVGLGIGVIFGAGQIVSALGATSTC